MNELIKNIPEKCTFDINIKGKSGGNRVEIEATVRTYPVKKDIIRKLKKREVTFQV